MGLQNRITCNRFDISSRMNEGKTTKTRTKHGKAIVEVSDVVSHAADEMRSREDVNKFVKYLMDNKKYSLAAWFIIGINTGFRCGDLAPFKVSDFDMENKPECVNIVEQKTGKARVIYLNDAVYSAVQMLIDKKNLQPDDYLFTSESSRKSYFVDWVRDGDGEIVDIITSNNRYDDDGNERKIAPMWVDSIARACKRETERAGISGHFSSHCARKTFSFFIASHEYKNKRNITAASMALNHSSEAVTETYYTKGVDAQELKEVWLNLNLGIEFI